MTVEKDVAEHYTITSLLDRIRAALAESGADLAAVTPDDLKPVDEFHVGGLDATRDLIAAVGLTGGMHVLDIGAGIGGTTRSIAQIAGCRVTGLDLTPEFVETARALSALCGMSGQTRFEVGSALEMPFADDTFDAATMIHVGMNIADKAGLMAEAARVLKPGGGFAIFDAMRTGAGELSFPTPWAETAETSFVESADAYCAAAAAAGFSVASMRDRRGFALDFYAARRAAAAARGGPPPLGQHILMGEDWVRKSASMRSDIETGLISVVELVLTAPDRGGNR